MADLPPTEIKPAKPHEASHAHENEPRFFAQAVRKKEKRKKVQTVLFIKERTK